MDFSSQIRGNLDLLNASRFSAFSTRSMIDFDFAKGTRIYVGKLYTRNNHSISV
jgi:hypothetical protein